MKLIVVKRAIIFAFALIVITGAVIGIGCGIAAAAYSAEQKVVVIDAGHGGVDAGVIGVNSSMKESDINLAIARYLKKYFSDAGFKAVLTRDTNGGLYGLPTKGFKMRDMKKRKEIIEKNDPDMVISIHQNFCPIPSRRGGTVFFEKTSESGIALAKTIQAELNNMEDCAEENEALYGDYYMLKCTQSPSVIVECGFLSNAEDEKLLISADYQKKIAYAIFKGAVGYYS